MVSSRITWNNPFERQAIKSPCFQCFFLRFIEIFNDFLLEGKTSFHETCIKRNFRLQDATCNKIEKIHLP